jgi:hypothetical protein
VKCAIALLPKDVIHDVGPGTKAMIEDLTAFVRDYRLVRAAAQAIGAKPPSLECEDAE